MMLKFLSDARDVIRLRFQTVGHYHYPAQVWLTALFVLGMVNAALFAAFIGSTTTPAAAALMLAITAVKWLLLSFIMQVFLHYRGAPKMNLFGFVLLTEFLNVPLIVTAYLPVLGAFGLAWQFWTLFVQVRGLMVFSRISPWWIGLAYVVYFVAASFAGMVLLSFFIANGWVDENIVEQYMNLLQQTQQAQ